jgi:hypothetical protein
VIEIVDVVSTGAAQSGKTTIYKLFKIMHDNGFSDREKQNIKEIIILNINLFLSRVLSSSPLGHLPPELQVCNLTILILIPNLCFIL